MGIAGETFMFYGRINFYPLSHAPMNCHWGKGKRREGRKFVFHLREEEKYRSFDYRYTGILFRNSLDSDNYRVCKIEIR